jgi:riboflavin synthase
VVAAEGERLMFTGIVEAMGDVVSVETRGDVVSAVIGSDLAASLALGSSIAVNGCCLTAVDPSRDRFRVELTPETMRRTAFGRRLVAGAKVNLERAMRADGRLEGHIVQGHVDGVGALKAMNRLGQSAEATFSLPPALARYLVEKGSVAVDGISLTVAALAEGTFMVALIPHTLDVTTLGALQAGDPVNLEVDVLAKYVERLLGPHAGGMGGSAGK